MSTTTPHYEQTESLTCAAKSKGNTEASTILTLATKKKVRNHSQEAIGIRKSYQHHKPLVLNRRHPLDLEASSHSSS
jgi:hypothetical protein